MFYYNDPCFHNLLMLPFSPKPVVFPGYAADSLSPPPLQSGIRRSLSGCLPVWFCAPPYSQGCPPGERVDVHPADEFLRTSNPSPFLDPIARNGLSGPKGLQSNRNKNKRCSFTDPS